MLSRFAAPTLVWHNRRNRWQPASASQRIAAGIRGAQFRVIDDIEYEHVASLIEEFILGSASPSGEAGRSPPAPPSSSSPTSRTPPL
jgi:hypothetical protein